MKSALSCLPVVVLIAALVGCSLHSIETVGAEKTSVDNTRWIEVEHIPVPAGVSGLHPDVEPAPGLGSGYTAIVCDKDDRVYVGTAFYGSYGSLLMMDPRRRPKKLEVVASIKDIVREDLTYGINTQSKTHTRLICDNQGHIWGATKQGNEIFGVRPELGELSDGFPGGHLYCYNPKTGIAIDHGILKKQQGVMTGAYDPKREMLYYRTEPLANFISYNIKTGEVCDKGRVGSLTRYIDIDKWGNVWIPATGSIVKYDVERDEMRDLTAEFINGNNVTLDTSDVHKYVYGYSCVTGPDGTTLYSAPVRDSSKDGSGMISEFDLTSEHDGKISARQVCRLAPKDMRATDVHTMTRSPDGKIYWTAETNNPAQNSRHELHIMRYDPKTRKGEDVGALWLKPLPGDKPDEGGKIKGWSEPYDGRELPNQVGNGVQGSTFDSKGNLYIKVIGWPGYGVLTVPRKALK